VSVTPQVGTRLCCRMLLQAGAAAGAAKLVTKSDIFDYMDGAGELYLAYDFHDLAARVYGHASQPKITAEVYRLGSSADA